MIRPLLIALFALCSFSGQAQLRVHEAGRTLVTAEGKPFFWLGDTAWELFHRLTFEEADMYLRKRAEQGFTVIQAVALAELDGLHTPNAYGELPLEGDDPTRPRAAYFLHMDRVIDRAAELGLQIALLPTWGDKLFKERWGIGPEIFTPANARAYGQWIGNRYRDRKNIVWVLGGDRNPRGPEDIAVWRAMAAGIEAGAGGRNRALITFHPQPVGTDEGGSAVWFGDDEWLDFNMLQTGHCRNLETWRGISAAYNRKSVKPVLNGEPLYEDHPVCFNAKDLGYSSAYDVRRGAWLDVLSGTLGHTYGCHDVWQMHAPQHPGVNGPRLPWYVALDLPGAVQMKHLRSLMESRSWLERTPDTALVTDLRSAAERIAALRGKDWVYIYSAAGYPFTVRLGRTAGRAATAEWLDPRSGERKPAGRFPNSGTRRFVPPSSGYGQDWALVIISTQEAL